MRKLTHTSVCGMGADGSRSLPSTDSSVSTWAWHVACCLACCPGHHEDNKGRHIWKKIKHSSDTPCPVIYNVGLSFLRDSEKDKSPQTAPLFLGPLLCPAVSLTLGASLPEKEKIRSLKHPQLSCDANITILALH